MRVRKEQGFLLGSALVLGLFLRADLTKTDVRQGSGAKTPKTLAPNTLPDVSAALPDTTERGTFHRDLFSPPSDTVALPPLELELPPFEPLPALAPPSAWGPAPRHAHRLLRRELSVVAVPELFQVAEEGAAPEAAAGTEARVAPVEAPERAAAIEGYKKLYDWILAPTLLFGHIRNPDRFGLAERAEEKIDWVEVDPATGELRHGGSVAPIERSRVSEFHFADTAANRLELGRRAFGRELRPPQLESALLFAEECLRQRNDVPKALALAEEIFRLAAAIAAGDPRPRLGLARCLELGFRFEEAFLLYAELLGEIQGQEAVYVHARFADLLARFRMFERAEEHYRLALQRSNQNWEARFRYGRYLLDRGSTDEALAQLSVAHEHEPRFPEAKLERSAVRTTFAAAHLQAGHLAEAQAAFERALNNDPEDPRALAGLFAAALHSGSKLSAERETLLASALEHGIPGADFELLLSLGLVAIERGEWTSAQQNLERAAQADPFRAGLALRARSWLAELTGHSDEALRSIQTAYENDPTDAWTLYQRGRVLLAFEDTPGARSSLEAALEREADFVDALSLLGEIAQLDGRHDEAELYYERTLLLDPSQARVHARRGYNHLARNDIDAARTSFLEATKAAEVPSALLGLAWCSYVLGDVTESTTLLGELADSLRDRSPDDPWRAWAESQIARILEHESKEVWIDRFDRRAGDPANGWLIELGTGLEVGIVDGRVLIDGQIGSGGRTRILRSIPAGDFVNWQAEVTVEGSTAARAGIFLALEKKVGPAESGERAAAMLSRNKDGAVQSRFVQSGNADAPHLDVPGASWPTDRPVPIRIERSGEGNESNITIYMDGVPVVENMRVAALGTVTTDLRFGVFVEGDPARPARVSMDNVEVVRRVKR